MANRISRRDMLALSAAAAVGAAWEAHAVEIPLPAPAPPPAAPDPTALFERVTLEMSLKPFRVLRDDAIRAVAAEVFRQWGPLIRRAQACSILLWTADGSEILDYRGRKDDELEWARYIGIGHPPQNAPAGDPHGKSLHERSWLYCENPPKITYAWLKTIVGTLKEVGTAQTGKPVTVGATFDPGPEFARSPFKYERHPEIAAGTIMGAGRWVSCAAVLKADQVPYAGFPQGIPEGTTLGTFLGRQSRHFLGDLGFDYLWLSNGFGFSLSSWSVKGGLFDGKSFDAGKAGSMRAEILRFWRDFRRECPQFPLETRGSNLTVGADLASAASPIGDIYRSGFQMAAPPNSPWAALDGDFGLEVVGYLSRIAELPPDERFPFRFYTHDPWWLNSPWFDRYGREPHDIYLPLSVARIDRQARITRPARIEFLTIDDSYGRMPDACPQEVIPHVMRAMEHFSDAPGPLTWVYPFDEYHALVFGQQPRPAEPFFGDWFMRGAVNAGLPLNTVVSTGNFLQSRRADPEFYGDTILLSPVPDAGSPLEQALLDSLRRGRDVLLYGPVAHAGAALLEVLNLRRVAPLSGELAIRNTLEGDRARAGQWSGTLNHREVLSAGGIDTVLARPDVPGCHVWADVSAGAEQRVFALSRRSATGAGGGQVGWVRGSFCCSIGSGHLPVPDDPRRWFPAELLLRWILAEFGYRLRFDKPAVTTRNPLVLVARSNNGFFFSGYCPSTATGLRLRFPHEAPILVGTETWLEQGSATYSMPRAWHHEARCFVEQQADGEVGCAERLSGDVGIRRRLILRGLQVATVHFYPELRPASARVIMAANDQRPNNTRSIDYATEDRGRRLVARAVTGDLLISW